MFWVVSDVHTLKSTDGESTALRDLRAWRNKDLRVALSDCKCSVMKIRTNYYITGKGIALIYIQDHRAEHGQSPGQLPEKLQRYLMDKLLNIRLSEARL